MMNTSQDPEYYGPTGHEKKFHKTHFGVVRTLAKRKYKSLRDDPDYEEFKPGRFRKIKKENEDGKEKSS